MGNPNYILKSCPICGVAMTRLPTDGRTILFRCDYCKTEIIKAIPRDSERRRVSSSERRAVHR